MKLSRRNFVKSLSAATLMASGWSTVGRAGTGPAPDYEAQGAELRSGTPAAAGFRFPAEWERHDYTIMVFPYQQNWWRGQLKAARQEWAATANAIADFEPVFMVVHPDDMRIARKMLRSDIELWPQPVNDAWARDSGPMVLTSDDGKKAVAGFTFNGWGEKFPPYRDDMLLKGRLAGHLDLPIYPTSLVLEGGGVTVDGAGTVITTTECTLHDNRNPGWTSDEAEAVLKDYLGVSKVIWLPEGLKPDPVTDGHVDGLCAFADPGVVLLHTTDDRNDVNYGICQAAKAILQDSRDAAGRELEVIEIPLADDLAHMNFYICNDAVIVPTAGDPRQDERPLAILREVFNDRSVIPVLGQTLAAGGGGVHCITQQVPAV